jgi:Spy/CpxP family protein refolding chaperone
MEAGAGVEMILRLRDDLALTEGQVQQLDAMRQELVERRTAARSEVEELQSQARAGALTREELREQMQARRDAAVGGLDEQRERIEGVLTEAQRAQLQELRESRGPRQGRRGGGPDGVRPRRPGRPPAPGR